MTFVMYELFENIGNAGGYVGLFVGYALVNVPGLLISAFTQIRTKIFGSNNN